VHFIASQAIARSQAAANGSGESDEAKNTKSETSDAMAALERQAKAPVGFVAASSGPEIANGPGPKKIDVNPSAPVNPDAINIDVDDDDD